MSAGKFLMYNQKAKNGGAPVTIMVGVVAGDLMGNDKKNVALCEFDINRIFSQETEEHYSPEDFLEGLDDIDWKEVLKNGKSYER